MALSLQTQWKLVAAGLMAHADQVMTGEECERLMMLVEQDVDDDEYADWLALVSDPDKLRAMFESLDPPDAGSHRTVLEEAWLMAVVDGERHEDEVAMLSTIAERMGVESVQLEFWREAWTQAQSERAETTVRALARLLGDGPEDGKLLDAVLFELPTTTEHRDALAAIAKVEQSREDVARRIGALSKPLRRDVIHRLAEAANKSADPDGAKGELAAIAGESGMTEDEIASYLHGA